MKERKVWLGKVEERRRRKLQNWMESGKRRERDLDGLTEKMWKFHQLFGEVIFSTFIRPLSE